MDARAANGFTLAHLSHSSCGKYLRIGHEAAVHRQFEPGDSEQDERRHMRATARVQVENEWAKVTEWRFAPGAETGHHVHQYDYIVVPMTSGLLRLEDSTGSREVTLTSGVSYAREKGVSHNVINANAFEFRFLEIEILRGNG
jgi:quercetin dioxygenase-like cupin family protein